MQAVRFIGVGRPAQIEDVRKPAAGPGQVLIKIGGAGVCHPDLHVMEEDLGFRPPFTLGHENAGWVAALGEGVAGFKEGDAVAVYGPWGCGRCHSCQLSMENYCENWAQIDGFGGGLGLDGGMAEYMLVPSARLLVPLAELSPAKAAPLRRRGANSVSRYQTSAATSQRGQYCCRPRRRRTRPHGHSTSARAGTGAHCRGGCRQ
jgi:alcohol dehydrogenase, propanol-preferring